MRQEMTWAGIFVAIGLMVLGFSLKKGMESNQEKERVVAVKGLAEREVSADKVIWNMAFRNVNNSMPELLKEIDSHKELIMNFLTQNGLEKDVEITTSVPDVLDLKAERYVMDRIEYRYNATTVITIASTKVDLVRSLMNRQTELQKEGLAFVQDYQYPNQFLFMGLNDIKPQMIEEATKNARVAAEKFAEDSDSKLGKIKRADQGTFTISDRDMNTPYIKTIRVVTKVEYYLKD